MANKRNVYFEDLPFQLRRDLCDILDADRRWEELGRIHMVYDMTTFIRQAVSGNRSPTWELLKKYSEKEGTVKQLFVMLENMNHQRAMTVLKPYVDEKYQCVLQTEVVSTTIGRSLTNFADMFELPSEFPMTTSCSSPSTSTQDHISGAEGFSGKQKGTLSTSSKLNNDSLNLNTEFCKNFPNSKMNDLNIPRIRSRGVAIKKSPKHFNFETNSSSYEDSGLTKGIPEKIKEALNPSYLEDSLQDIKQISIEDICKATGYFRKERILSSEGFGTVYRGECKGKSVTVKRFIRRYDSAQQLESVKQFLNELNTVKILHYDYLLPLHAVSYDRDNLCLIYPFMVNGSLEDRLLLKNKTPPLTWSQRSHIAECIAKGLNYLHTAFERPLIHGNIKSSNILLDANMNAKIGEFVLTREGPGCQGTHISVSNIPGTAGYLPSEYLRHKYLSPEVDIYSYGIVLLEISTGLRPFDAKRGKGTHLTDHVQLFAINGRLESLRDIKSGEENMIWYQKLLYMGQICSNVERKKRPPLSQILLWFEKIKQDLSMFDGIQWLPNDESSSSLSTNLSAFEVQWHDDLQRSTRSETFPKDVNFSLETSRDPGCSAGVSGVSVSHKELLMASSSAQADALSCESPSSGEVDRALGSSPVVSEPEQKERSVKVEISFGRNSPSIYLQFCDNRGLQLNLPTSPVSNNLRLAPTSVQRIVEEYEQLFQSN